MREVAIKVFKFDELNEETKTKVFGLVIDFLIETYDEDTASEGMKKAVAGAERMRTPWFTDEYVREYCRDEVMKICQQAEYEKDGRVFAEEMEEKNERRKQ